MPLVNVKTCWQHQRPGTAACHMHPPTHSSEDVVQLPTCWGNWKVAHTMVRVWVHILGDPQCSAEECSTHTHNTHTDTRSHTQMQWNTHYLFYFVPKEMDGLDVVLLHKLQTEALVPASGVDIDADLAADGKLQPHIGELLPQGFHKLDADMMLLRIKTKPTQICIFDCFHQTSFKPHPVKMECGCLRGGVIEKGC